MIDHTLRLLFLDQYGQIGGGQRILLDLIGAARREGWHVDLLCPAGPLADAARLAGAEIHVLVFPLLPDGPKSIWTMARALIASRRAARTHGALARACDLMVVNGPRTLAIVRTWVRQFRRPAALYLHGVYGRLENRLIRSFLALPRTAAIAVSEQVRAPFSDLRHVFMVSNWVSSKFLTAAADPLRLRLELGITDAHPIVLVPGRFSPNKGQRLVLGVSALLSDIPLHFVFAGAALFEAQGREVEEALRAQAARSPLRIHVAHWREALPSLYDGADIVVVPSVWEEPFGLTAVEAMARRRPLIVTDRGTLPEITDHGRAARIVKPDAEAIASTLRAYFTDPVGFEEAVRRARDRVETLYDPLRQQHAVLQVLRTLLPS